MLLALVGALLAAVSLTACTGKDAVDQSSGDFRFVSGTSKGKLIDVAKRTQAGAFSGDGLSGGTINLADYAGKIVVINFWATWCGPCTVETPQFDSVYRTVKDKGVQFVGIDTKETSRDSARAVVTDNKITYPMMWDEQGKTAVALGKIPAQALPFTVLLDKQHRVAAVYLSSLSAKDLQPVLNTLIAET